MFPPIQDYKPIECNCSSSQEDEIISGNINFSITKRKVGDKSKMYISYSTEIDMDSKEVGNSIKGLIDLIKKYTCKEEEEE